MYFTQNATIGLASKSPRRIELLKSLGINFDLIINNKTELKPNKNELPKSYSIKTSNDKLIKLNNDNKEFIIAADTIISFQNQIFGKPEDENNAFEMLSKFSNNSHEVITTISILNTKTGDIKYNTKVTKVHFKNWDQKNIRYYINNFDIKDNVSFENDIVKDLIKKEKLYAYCTNKQYYYLTNFESLKNFEKIAIRQNIKHLNTKNFN